METTEYSIEQQLHDLLGTYNEFLIGIEAFEDGADWTYENAIEVRVRTEPVSREVFDRFNEELADGTRCQLCGFEQDMNGPGICDECDADMAKAQEDDWAIDQAKGL